MVGPGKYKEGKCLEEKEKGHKTDYRTEHEVEGKIFTAKEICNSKLQVCLCMYDLLVDTRR